MHIECPTCKMLVDEDKYDRCPRCHTLLQQPSGCAGCQGCSFKWLCPAKKQAQNES